MYTTELSRNMTIVSALKPELTIIFLKYVLNRSLTCLKSILRHNLNKYVQKVKNTVHQKQ